MTFLYGTSLAGVTGFLLIISGYALAGFLAKETPLTRLALASLVGLAWVVLAASVFGAWTPLSGPVVGLTWIPAIAVILTSKPRRQFFADLSAGFKSPEGRAAVGGLALLWLALLLPFLVYPDLAFFDGKTNHDNFFWCVGAEFLQHHDYLDNAAKSRDYPLFNSTWSFCGWQPAWARMGSEGFIAIASATFGQNPVRMYNFLASALSVPWLLTSLALARRMGLPALGRSAMTLACFCQPLLFFFVANGNLPNLFGALFSGGIWLLALMSGEQDRRPWVLGAIAMLVMHGMLASYPEIVIFSLASVGLLALRPFFTAFPGRARILGWIVAVMVASLCLNPLTTARLWSGIQNSIGQVQHASGWANIFSRVTLGGYIPSLITLGIPSVRLYGLAGGLLASIAVLGTACLVFRFSPRRWELFFSLSGFFALLIYTIVSSFGYGWQKSVQFSGMQIAVIFPFLAAGAAQTCLRAAPRRRLPLLLLAGTAVVMIHGMVGVIAENLKSAGTKGLTFSSLALRDRMAVEFPHQPLYVDGATFRASFFQSMWSAEIFARNPLIFVSRQIEAGGYLRDFVNLTDPASPPPNGLYYVATNWADAFDYDSAPLYRDRVGVLLKQHNLVTEFTGFYRTTGLPLLAKPECSLTLYPYADGWLEFTLQPNGKAQRCQLLGSVTTSSGAQKITVDSDANQRMVARFPLKAGESNVISVAISGGPTLDPESNDPPYAFQVMSIRSARAP